MRLWLIILLICVYSCSTAPQIQLPNNPIFSTKGYVDTAIQKNIEPLTIAINNLNIQQVQDKKTIDSLKNEIIKNTIRIDTSSGSDFSIKNGVMTFNKPNLSKMIKAVVLTLPVKKTIAKKKKK